MLKHIRARRRARFMAAVSNRSAIRKILLVRNGLVGDVVFITATIGRLRRTFPQAVLDVVVSEQASDLMREIPGIGTVYTLSSSARLKDHIRLFRVLKKNAYDLEIILEDNPHYTLLSLLTSARWLATFSSAFDLLADFSVPWQKGSHAVISELEPVREWTDQPPSGFRDAPRLFVSQAESEESAIMLLQSDIRAEGFVACFHIGCSEPHSVRQWVPERYTELADILVKKHQARILFTGTEKDTVEIEEIRRRMNSPSVSFAGKTTLRQLMAVLQRSSVVIGPDTGALHIASALGTPTVMIMGYTDPADTRPFDDLRPPLCMQTLLTQQVLDAVEELLLQPSLFEPGTR